MGSNLGDRGYHLRRAQYELSRIVTIVRVSSVVETEPVDAPAGSGRFLNAVVLGTTQMRPEVLLSSLLAIERKMGRRRRGVRNEPRVIDLDLIAYSAVRMHTERLTLPHPRASQRQFVMQPLRQVAPFQWP
jgi:2-amino-4-hydroxy-6-hydroxymethyldihydropteridine diphosphokinase